MSCWYIAQIDPLHLDSYACRYHTDPLTEQPAISGTTFVCTVIHASFQNHWFTEREKWLNKSKLNKHHSNAYSIFFFTCSLPLRSVCTPGIWKHVIPGILKKRHFLSITAEVVTEHKVNPPTLVTPAAFSGTQAHSFYKNHLAAASSPEWSLLTDNMVWSCYNSMRRSVIQIITKWVFATIVT